MSFENLKHIFEEHGTTTGTNAKAFFPEIPQPYVGNPPNSNLINFNSNNDNFPTTIPTTPNSIFNSSSPLNSFNTTPINELFSETAFPENYTPQNTLNADGNFVNNNILAKQTWGRLYNDDHTSKNISNPSPRSENPFQPFTYPNSGDLNIRSKASTFLGIPARVDGLGFGRGEPYIISKIPAESGGSSLNGRVINFGNRTLPLVRATTDTIRIGKYLTSPQGLLEIGLKNADLLIPQTVVRKGDELIRVPQRFNTGYNPLSTLFAVSPIARLIGHGPAVLSQSGFTGRYDNQPTAGLTSQKLTANIALGDKPEYNINDTFTKATDDGESDGLFSLKNLSSFLTRGGKVKKTSSGDKMTLAKMIKGNTLDIKSGQTVGLDKENTLNFNIEEKKRRNAILF